MSGLVRYDSSDDAAEDLADEQRASFFQNVRRCGQLDGGAHAHVKDREDSQRTAEERLGKGTEELRSAGREGNDGCADEHRDHHQATGHTLDRAQYRDLFHGKGNQKTTQQSNRGRITLACIAHKSLEICGRCRLWQLIFKTCSSTDAQHLFKSFLTRNELVDS